MKVVTLSALRTVFLDKLVITHLVMISVSLGIEKFITVGTRVRYWTLHWTKQIQPTPFYTYYIHNMSFQYYPPTGPSLPRKYHMVPSLDDFRWCYCTWFSSVMRVTRPSHPIRFNFITQITLEELGKPDSFVLYSFLLPSSKIKVKWYHRLYLKKSPDGFISTNIHKQ
jgi:hypothetical protein